MFALHFFFIFAIVVMIAAVSRLFLFSVSPLFFLIPVLISMQITPVQNFFHALSIQTYDFSVTVVQSVSSFDRNLTRNGKLNLECHLQTLALDFITYSAIKKLYAANLKDI